MWSFKLSVYFKQPAVMNEARDRKTRTVLSPSAFTGKKNKQTPRKPSNMSLMGKLAGKATAPGDGGVPAGGGQAVAEF